MSDSTDAPDGSDMPSPTPPELAVPRDIDGVAQQGGRALNEFGEREDEEFLYRCSGAPGMPRVEWESEGE